MTKLQELSRELVAWLVGAVSAPSPTDWVLIAVALGGLYRLWGSLRARTQVGPVEVDLLECDDGTPVQVHALTALLRERLANSGLPAPQAVPAGAPQTDLVSAVAASPIPHAAWIASMLALLRPPQPRQYKLSGTVFGKDGIAGCGISFWLRPSRRGPVLLTTVHGESHKAAIESAALKIYVCISKNAVRAFPEWTRWHREEALREFDAGGIHADAGRLNAALTCLNTAAELERDNAVAQLQLANLCEQLAEDPSDKAAVLRRYLDIAIQWPWLVEARYRISVVAGGLSGLASKQQHAAERPRIVERMSMTTINDQSLDRWLMELASRESKAVRQLLRPWYTLLRKGRGRYQFEPRGSVRRELKRTVNTSKHCLRVRKELNRGPGPRSLIAAWKINLSELIVRCWHLSVLRGRVSWQTHYIAACFYALLLESERHADPAVLERWRERAFSHLNRAIDEGGTQLSKAWIEAEGDPDLQSLRVTDDPSWTFVQSRLGLQVVEKPVPESKQILGEYSVRLPNRDPVRPWRRHRIGTGRSRLAGAARRRRQQTSREQ